MDTTFSLNKVTQVSKELAYCAHSISRQTSKNPHVGDLEQYLFSQFPAIDGEEWDKNGLLVGNPQTELSKVVLALDSTIDAINYAAECGAQVLITHHPSFLEAPCAFSPLSIDSDISGSVVFEAIRQGIALMNFHTPLDASHEAQAIFAEMLGMNYVGLTHPLVHDESKGYGQILQVENGEGLNLRQLAGRVTSVFGRTARVWGNPYTEITLLAHYSGSLGQLGRDALKQGISCIVCGEVKYHEALELSQKGMSIIELGHDVSEFPLVGILANKISEFGITSDNITILDQGYKWNYPESVRV